ncbi:MAG: YdiU family protein [Bdellovibrionales bacterium]
MIQFDNTYIDLPDSFYERVKPAKFSNPKLIQFNESLAVELGLDFQGVSDKDLALIFSGQKLIPGSEPVALAYAGFQFGHPVPQLGDGRAHLLGETRGHDIQLKGSGPTRFSRGGDGKSALGPVLREYIVSEAMHHLGVPTSRALCAVTTGEMVRRQAGLEPGGVFTRVAKSHIRVGTFQYFAFKNDVDAIKKLIDYTIRRHYPSLLALTTYREKAIELVKQVIELQSTLVAQWSGLGFIHGVMNTDNCSIAGITIDYGPCAFLDEFEFQKVFSSIDRGGRYSYFNQVPIAKWNILRLVDCLLPLIDEDLEKASQVVENEIFEHFGRFDYKRMQMYAQKLGIKDYVDADDELIMTFLQYLEDEKLDFTLAFRNLKELFKGVQEFYPSTPDLQKFLVAWRARVKNVDLLDQINPVYIPRNHHIQQAIESAYAGEMNPFYTLLKVYADPFNSKSEYLAFQSPPSVSEKVHETFCGT